MAPSGAAAAGMGELLAGLHAFGDSLPTQDEWMQMLAHCGFPDAVHRQAFYLPFSFFRRVCVPAVASTLLTCSPC